jgi:hypothetical protein
MTGIIELLGGVISNVVMKGRYIYVTGTKRRYECSGKCMVNLIE